MNYPIIRFEIDGLRHSVIQAITEHAAIRDKDIQDAVNKALTVENVQKIISATAEREIHQAITQCVQEFFRFGGGRETIKKVVEAKLNGEAL